MHAIGEACQNGELQGKVSLVAVISSREGVSGIRKAQKLGIPVEMVLRKDFPKGYNGVDAYGEALKSVLAKYSPDVVTLNGFLAKVSEEVICEHEGNIFNQHPGPVPDFGGEGMYGRRVHAAVIIFSRLTERIIPYTEMIAQRVSPAYDHGAVVKCAKVEILPQDTVDSLQERSLPIEHQLQIQLLHNVADGVVKEVVSRVPYVCSMDYAILNQAKRIAKLLYPNG